MIFRFVFPFFYSLLSQSPLFFLNKSTHRYQHYLLYTSPLFPSLLFALGWNIWVSICGRPHHFSIYEIWRPCVRSKAASPKDHGSTNPNETSVIIFTQPWSLSYIKTLHIYWQNLQVKEWYLKWTKRQKSESYSRKTTSYGIEEIQKKSLNCSEIYWGENKSTSISLGSPHPLVAIRLSYYIPEWSIYLFSFLR